MSDIENSEVKGADEIESANVSDQGGAETAVLTSDETVSEQTGVTAEDEKTVKKGILHYFLHGVISTYFIGIIMMYVGAMFGSLFVQIPLKITGLLTDEHPVVITAASYLAFIGVWGFVIGYILLFKSDSPYLHRIIGKPDRRAVIGWILGCLIIGGMNLICILCAMGNGDIHLYFGSFDIIPLVFLFVAVFIQSGAEEILCRGFMYRRLEKTYNPVAAMIFNALFFTLLHAGNPGSVWNDIKVKGKAYSRKNQCRTSGFRERQEAYERKETPRSIEMGDRADGYPWHPGCRGDLRQYLP